ncbi:MAG TPA: hypothetical protein DHE23_12785 [Agrobacterium sp.]|nr:hypothetical protein [Agrobacterium sp.]
MSVKSVDVDEEVFAVDYHGAEVRLGGWLDAGNDRFEPVDVRFQLKRVVKLGAGAAIVLADVDGFFDLAAAVFHKYVDKHLTYCGSLRCV